MTRIGLISDTHSFIDPAIFKYLKNCDEIWHAGDIGDICVLDQLKSFKPLKAVYGNIDAADVRSECPLHYRFMCEEVDVWMTHIGGYPKNYATAVRQKINKKPPKLFISGHSHILKVIYDKKLSLLHMNPGAAGNHGFHNIKTLLRFAVDGKDIKNLEIIEFGKN
jgi:putative phosphoesterase